MPRWDDERAERPAASRRIYDGLALLFLMWPATGGMWLLGSTRAWGFAPGVLRLWLLLAGAPNLSL